MKTAMQELIEYIELYQPKNKITDGIWSKEKSLLEKEKEQIEKAVTYGNRQDYYDATEELGNHYYNQTFKN